MIFIFHLEDSYCLKAAGTTSRKYGFIVVFSILLFSAGGELVGTCDGVDFHKISSNFGCTVTCQNIRTRMLSN